MHHRSSLPFAVIFVALSTAAAAEDIAFRRHILNPDSEFSACAVIDVNGDGQPDIFSGGFWYEGPTWKRHKTRDVQLIGNRYDDYSNLPLDVDGDGWTDVISVNYRSRSLYWVRHPGPSLGEWTRHVIDTPGPSETGRLVDVNSDGQLDVLPDGTKFAAWYERSWEQQPDGTREVKWTRHALPDGMIAHGIGCGDIDGDGLNDLVSPKGWAEATIENGELTWIWHDEFRRAADENLPPLTLPSPPLSCCAGGREGASESAARLTPHRDCGTLILVSDVDGDGDNDIIWGRGHDTGLYWAEQSRDANDARSWTQHAIDTSWSQAHSLMLADIDGDGHDDLVTGKRYMGHDGKDPGEYDPLVVYWYRFMRKTRTWQRHLVSWGADCGFDLDPRCADVDADGDIDIVGAARSGLFLLENLRIKKTEPTGTLSSTRPDGPAYEDHSRLMVYRDAEGQEHPVESPWDWGRRRSHILGNMQRVMGPLPGPERRVPLDVQVLGEEETEHYIRRKITYAAEPGNRVPAYLLIPKHVAAKAPAVLCLHPTSPLGKAQICGLGGKPSRFYAHELAERGYVCLAPDYPSFGDYAYDFATDGAAYDSGTMKGIWNHIRGVDLLESLPTVNADRIGVIGHSLGGHNALFVAAFDQRLRAVVTSCGFNAFEDYYEGDLRGWASDRYMPAIRERHECDPQRMPFDFHEVLAAMAPRPVFVNAPLHASQVYGFLQAGSRLRVEYPDAAHDFPESIRLAVYKWLDTQLKR